MSNSKFVICLPKYVDMAFLTLSGPSFLQLHSFLGQIFLESESLLQPASHFARYLKEYLMDHVEIFRKLTSDILQKNDVIDNDVIVSRDWKRALNYGN